MTFNEFSDYMENNLEGYQTFYKKALAYQNTKNAARKKKAWNEAKVERATLAMWKQVMQGLYDNLKPQIENKESKTAWIDYMNEKQIFESVNDSMTELEFE